MVHIRAPSLCGKVMYFDKCVKLFKAVLERNSFIAIIFICNFLMLTGF